MHPSLVNAARILSHTPLRLALTAAASAATVAAVVGVAAGPVPATTTAGSVHAASFTSAVTPARDAGTWSPLHAVAPGAVASHHHAGDLTLGQAVAAQHAASTQQADSPPRAGAGRSCAAWT